MSAEGATAGRDAAAGHGDQGSVTEESLYVVSVQDHIDGRIAGHDGGVYVSPPATRDSALTLLVGLLLGSGSRPANGTAVWTHAVPGGRRTITLARASDRTD